MRPHEGRAGPGDAASAPLPGPPQEALGGQVGPGVRVAGRTRQVGGQVPKVSKEE